MSELSEDCCLCLVYRLDGITKLQFISLMAEDAKSAQVYVYMRERERQTEREREIPLYMQHFLQIFKTSVNKLAHHLLDFQLSVHTYMKKQ